MKQTSWGLDRQGLRTFYQNYACHGRSKTRRDKRPGHNLLDLICHKKMHSIVGGNIQIITCLIILEKPLSVEQSTSHTFSSLVSPLGALAPTFQLSNEVSRGKVTCCSHWACHLEGKNSNPGLTGCLSPIHSMLVTLLPSCKLARASSKVIGKEVYQFGKIWKSWPFSVSSESKNLLEMNED